MKRFTVALALLMCCLILFSCVNGSDENQTESGGENIKLWDLEGREFIVASHWIQYYLPEEGVTHQLDETRAWWKQVEADLNCKLVPLACDSPINLLPSISAGIKYADMIYIEGRNMYNLAKQGSLENLDDLKNIDPYDAKHWSQNLGRELYTYNGITYGVVAAGVLESVGQLRGGGMICNDSLIKLFDLPNPHELYEQKKWTKVDVRNL